MLDETTKVYPNHQAGISHLFNAMARKVISWLEWAVRRRSLANVIEPNNAKRVLNSHPAPFTAIVNSTTIGKNYLNAITPNNPSTLLFGPAVKNN